MKKILLSFFMCMLAIIGMQAAEYSYTFESKQFTENGTKTLNGVDWTLSGDYSGSCYWGYEGGDTSRGQQFGKGGSAYSNLIFSTSGIKGTINKIVINTATTNGGDVKLVVTVGGVNYGSETSLTTSATDYTFTGSSSGEIVFTYNQTTTKAIYIKSITIDYTPEGGEQPGEGGGDEPETPVEPTPDPEDVDMYVWTLVEDASTLVAGDKVVIAAADSDYALSTNQKSSNRGAVEVAKNGNLLNINADVQQLTLEAGTVDNTWAFNTGDGYLYAASSSGNQLKTKQELDAKGSFIINIEDKVTTVEASDQTVRNKMQYNYNNGTPLFSCYASYDLVNRQYVSLYRREYAANITSNNCYVVAVGNVWEEPAGCWYAAKFINKNTGEFTWSAVSESDAESHGYLFYLAPGNTPLGHEPQLDPDYKYTHVEFVQLPATVEAPADIRNLDLTDVEYKTSGEIWYDGKPSKVYSLVDEKWLDEATGVNRVELAGGIGYAYGVVSAEGAIEVYNVNGAVVARGNDNVDLRGLGRGVYIIRNGNQVRKVVR